MKQHSLLGQAIRFLCVGGGATALQYLILIALVKGMGLAAALASAIGYALSALFSYAANRHLTFNSDRAHRSALPRFLALVCVGLALNTATVWLLAQQLGLHYLISQLAATALALCWNFLAARCWAFAPQSQPSR